MTYCKVIIDGNIVSVGCTFLKWNPKRHRMNVCDVDHGQFLQSYDEKEIFRASWMKPYPPEAGEYEDVEIVVISETEYEDLKVLFEDGEEVQETEEPVIEISIEPPPEEEKPLTIAQMREIIMKQQEQIDRLMKKAKLK